MGIPSYFSHIIKEHRKIIKQISSNTSEITEYLFLDSNSIIYDVIRSLDYDEKDIDFEKNAIHEICKQIKYYIQLIKPTQKTMIAFDGVAPVAKLKQQQSRRYKNAYIKNKFPKKKTEWNTSAITPGTEFMQKLSQGVTTFFSQDKTSVIVSTSDDFGEGEHKIFHYIRENKLELKNKKIFVYGLDADLIMLTLQHLQYCPNMYLFRETPHFIKSIDKTLNPNELYALDIPKFAKIITNDIGTTPKQYAISDYIFISFMLGNDFMPHMPALNIRTNGIDRIFDAYKATISGKTYLTKDGKINWRSFGRFISYLAKNEYHYIKYEYGLREKQEKRVLRTMNHKTAEEKFDVSPQINRNVEHYINPSYDGWQWRYYKTLADIDINYVSKQSICINYLEALEWTLHYYTLGCKNTRWSYHYMYPPLLEDLTNYIPSFNNDLVDINKSPISAETQLAYVLPESSSHLLASEMREKMRTHYAKNAHFASEGAFCKYFWEAHIKISPLSLHHLEA